MSRRIEKIADQLQQEVAELLHRHVKHPALTEAMVSITRVEVSHDLAHARLHVSVLKPSDGLVVDGPDVGGPDDAGGPRTDSVLEALRRTEPFFHRELVKRLHLRRVPRLQFIADYSIAEGDRMSTIMREVKASDGREAGAGERD